MTLLSVKESLRIIKDNLANLGIVHDKFTSETQIVLNKEVEKVIHNLKDKNLSLKWHSTNPSKIASNLKKVPVL